MTENCEAPTCARDSRSSWRGKFKVCGLHYQRLEKYQSFDLPAKIKPEWASCTIAGCESPARTIKGKLCETHYYRRYRTGSTDDPAYGKKYVASHGYVVVHCPGHPVSTGQGKAYEHRKVLYDKIGGGEHPCNWCEEPVSWDIRAGEGKLVADHLDNTKTNNSPDNLVASCHSCNATRGLFMSWVFKHKNDPFLLKLFEAANDNTPRFACEAA